MRTSIILMLLLQTLFLQAKDNTALFNSANAAYKKNQFDSALVNYKKLEENKLAGVELYYNMANCYYKLNQLGHAIAYYEKAYRLDPTDEDIKANLRLANARITDKINIEEKGLSAWFKSVTYLFSADRFATLGLTLWILGFAGLIMLAYKIVKTGRFYFIGLIVTGSVLLLLGFIQYKSITKKSKAVIIASSVQIKTQPNDESKSVYNLHEGTKVNLHGQSDDWYEISIDNENYGWIKASDLIII